MKLAPLSNIELHVLSLTAIRCLIAKNVLSKEDFMADLARQGIDENTAFRLRVALDQIPEQ